MFLYQNCCKIENRTFYECNVSKLSFVLYNVNAVDLCVLCILWENTMSDCAIRWWLLFWEEQYGRLATCVSIIFYHKHGSSFLKQKSSPLFVYRLLLYYLLLSLHELYKINVRRIYIQCPH